MAKSTSWARGLVAAFLIALLGAQPAAAQDPFAGGWTLNPEMSNLSFQSVKKQTVVESSGFATFQGQIDESGAATVTVLWLRELGTSRMLPDPGCTGSEKPICSVGVVESPTAPGPLSSGSPTGGAWSGTVIAIGANAWTVFRLLELSVMAPSP